MRGSHSFLIFLFIFSFVCDSGFARPKHGDSGPVKTERLTGEPTRERRIEGIEIPNKKEFLKALRNKDSNFADALKDAGITKDGGFEKGGEDKLNKLIEALGADDSAVKRLQELQKVLSQSPDQTLAQFDKLAKKMNAPDYKSDPEDQKRMDLLNAILKPRLKYIGERNSRSDESNKGTLRDSRRENIETLKKVSPVFDKIKNDEEKLQAALDNLNKRIVIGEDGTVIELSDEQKKILAENDKMQARIFAVSFTPQSKAAIKAQLAKGGFGIPGGETFFNKRLNEAARARIGELKNPKSDYTRELNDYFTKDGYEAQDQNGKTIKGYGGKSKEFYDLLKDGDLAEIQKNYKDVPGWYNHHLKQANQGDKVSREIIKQFDKAAQLAGTRGVEGVKFSRPGEYSPATIAVGPKLTFSAQFKNQLTRPHYHLHSQFLQNYTCRRHFAASLPGRLVRPELPRSF